MVPMKDLSRNKFKFKCIRDVQMGVLFYLCKLSYYSFKNAGTKNRRSQNTPISTFVYKYQAKVEHIVNLKCFTKKS